MNKTRKLVLDILKPHHPDALKFSSTLADLGTDYCVKLIVTEVDKNTESTIVTIESKDLSMLSFTCISLVNCRRFKIFCTRLFLIPISFFNKEVSR